LKGEKSMTIPLQLIVLTIPALVYVAVRRWRGEKWSEAFGKAGWKTCWPKYFLWSLGIAILTGGLAWLAFRFIPPSALQSPNVNISDYAGWTLSVTSFLLAWLREAIYVALGEEIFFRGLLGGWLVRRLGFAVGNTVQALIFLLPHLLLLLVSLSLWPIILVQLLAGWLLGWLRYHSDSILPGWLAHSLINALGALGAMV
jgi:membrane protease YdiL (CAAX protease family)